MKKKDNSMNIGPQIIAYTESFLTKTKEKASIFRFKKGDTLSIESDISTNGTSCCFSIYAKILRGDNKFHMHIEEKEGRASKTTPIIINSEWTRHYSSLVLNHQITAVRCIIEFVGEDTCECALAHPSLTKGNHPVPYIPPGATRGRGHLWFDFRKQEKIFPIGTWVVEFMPSEWTSNILQNNKFATIASFLESEKKEILVGFDGKNKGKLSILVKDNIEIKLFGTNYYLNSIKHHTLIVTFDRASTYIYVNDTPVWSGENLFIKPTQQLYIGSPSEAMEEIDKYSDYYLNGWIKQVQGYKKSLYHGEIQDLSESLGSKPSVLPRIQKHDLIDEYLNDNELTFLKQIEFAIKRSFSYINTNDKEDKIRDHYAALLEGGKFTVTRENYQATGRTDLLVSYNKLPDSSGQHEFRTEFKIWGRRGYDEAPKQPIKYMGHDEQVAVFIMYDYSKNSKLNKMKDFFKECNAYPSTGRFIEDGKEIFDTNFCCFLSEHQRSSNNNVLIIAIYIQLN